MAILPVHSPHCFGIFKRSMIQADYLPLCEMLDSSVIAEAFEEVEISIENGPRAWVDRR